jgi:alpha-1,2-mannosyltransferase
LAEQTLPCMKTNNIPSFSGLKGKASFIIACLFFILAITINILPFLDGKNDLMDFGSFYASGLKIRDGENPYDPNSEYIFEINFSRVGAGGKMMNLNPPISVVLFRSLSPFEPHRSLIIWQVTSAILYAGIVFLLATTYKQNISPAIFLWSFTLAGFWHTLVLGQIYILLLLFTVLGWIFLQKGNYVPAGIAIGLVVAIKPNFILWPIFLLFSGYYLTFFMSILSSLVVSLIPVLFYGTKIYAQWLEASALHPETVIMPGNNSILGLTTRFGSIPAGIVISIIVILILLIWSKRKSSDSMEKPEYVSALGIIASLLASPISWTGYTILLLPIFFSLKKWTVLAMISAAILTVPFQLVLQFFQTSFVSFVIFGWFYGWGILFLLGALVKNSMMTSLNRSG